MPTFLLANEATGQALVLVENFSRLIGVELWSILLRTQPDSIESLIVSGFPEGSVVGYWDSDGEPVSFTVGDDNFAVVFEDGDTATLLQQVESLEILSGPTDDEEFILEVEVTNQQGATQIVPVLVNVLSVAEAPMVEATEQVVVSPGSFVALQINPTRSADMDNSELLSVRLVVAQDVPGSPIGTLHVPDHIDVPGVKFASLGTGEYSVTAVGDTQAFREAALDLLLSNGVVFTPRVDVAGEFPEGIRVIAISTETGESHGFLRVGVKLTP